MYNRYIRNDDGVYTRIPQEESPPASGPPPPGAMYHSVYFSFPSPRSRA